MSQKKNLKIYLALVIIIPVVALTVTMAIPAKGSGTASEKGLLWFKHESRAFVAKSGVLKESLRHISHNNPDSLRQARNALIECRLQYKHISFFMGYFFPEEANICNGPPESELEDALEYRDPVGLQVVESLLYSDSPAVYQNEMIKQAGLISRSVANILPSLDGFKMNDGDMLKSLRLELVRIMTLYITGFDAPLQKTGIEEARQSILAIDQVLAPFIKKHPLRDSLVYYLAAAGQYLRTHKDFDSFNRLLFITDYAMPIEGRLNQLINETIPKQDDALPLNSFAKNLFSRDAINEKAFPHSENKTDTLLVSLGKQLFLEPALSGSLNRSCASCHSPATFFADGLPKSRDLDGLSDLPRNTPSLLYAGYQYAQFWDGRVESLEEQINQVLKNSHEMNVSEDTVLRRLNGNPVYPSGFKKIWPGTPGISFAHTISALAAYVRTLAPFQSPFDRYMQGNRAALSASQQRGFNLFMGKAQCGTCHFAPLFNGLLPPDYSSTEFEVLGTTANDSLENPRLDEDKGRYVFSPFPAYKGAFKTPTVRNAAVTAPYMHNGAFKSLYKVIDFYEKGGGAGLGLPVIDQTLSSNPLHLTSQEKADIVAFIEALTDSK